MHKLLLLLIIIIVLSSALVLISPAHFQTSGREIKSRLPTPSPFPSLPITTGLCGKAIYVYGARKSENEYEKSAIATSVKLRTLDGKLITQTNSSSDGTFVLNAKPGEYVAYITDYDIKQKVTIHEGACTKTDLYINTP